MCQKYYCCTQIKDFDLDFDHFIDMLATTTTIKQEKPLESIPQGKKPSSHDVIIGKWTPSLADTAVGRKSGYGVITNIINGGIECGHGYNDNVFDRIGFYKNYSNMLGVDYGKNLDCYNQTPFA
ncbi:chitinase 8-like [Castanea sativa]|uniref:chitinase 8-like n=1 Tax=Castanea sativa TaxID=21020 RepID=UPI003F64A1BD